MQANDQLPLKQWAEQLTQARQARSLNQMELARELLFSPAQMRCIESGTLDAFHGTGYYLRAVEKYANHLQLTLDPPITALTLTDSQLALKRFKSSAHASSLAKRHANLETADKMPSSSRRTRLGIVLVAVIATLVSAGVWLSLTEGWPGLTSPETQSPEPKVASSTDRNVAPANIKVAADTGATSNPVSASESGALLPPVNMSPTEQPAIQTQSQTSLSVSATQSSQTSPPENLALQNTGSTPQATQTSPQSAAAQSPDLIKASFLADCWVEVRYLDGRIDQAIYKTGQSIEIAAKDVAKLTFGNASGVQATRKGKPFDIMTFTKGRGNVARISESDLN